MLFPVSDPKHYQNYLTDNIIPNRLLFYKSNFTFQFIVPSNINQVTFRCIIFCEMAPGVVVPANFGKHHLKSRSHSNLELLCDEGEIKRANSMILSLNSSVIDDLISRLDITSLDVQDFGAPAVGCFVESMYSGELEKCDKSNFRDLNKMGYVFSVSWFTERCLEYFTEHVDMLTGRCYEEVLFVVEEARFVEESQKKDNFTCLVEDKLNTMRNRKSMFLKQYANDLESISMSQLKMVIKIAGSDVGILVSILVTHHQKVGAVMLTETPGYLFKNIDFEKCFSNNRYCDITTKLFKILTENCGDNFNFKNSLEWIARFANKSNTEQNDPVVHRYPIMIDLTIKDLLHLDWDSLIELLAQSEKVCSLYQFFDAIYLWLHIEKNEKISSFPRLQFTENHIKDIVDIKEDRCWDSISSKYLEDMTSNTNSGTDILLKSFIDSDELTSDDGILFSSEDEYTIDKIFTEDVQITLVSDDKISACTEETKCAIMLQSTKVNETKPFSLTISHDVQIGCDKVHFHYPSEATEIISLLVRLTSEGNNLLFPIPFNCLPCKIRSDRVWTWGFNSFLKHGGGSSDQFRLVYGQEKNTKVLFRAIFTG